MKQSTQEELLFVRSQDEISLSTENARGRRLLYKEVVRNYGQEIVDQILDEGSAILTKDPNEPAVTIQSRRKALGLSISDVAKFLGEPVQVIANCEKNTHRNPVRLLQKICQVLGLDENKISSIPGADGDANLGIRLKEYANSKIQGRKNPVLETIFLSEASWVIRTQYVLSELLGITKPVLAKFRPSTDYGKPGRDGKSSKPAFKVGQELAAKARDFLDIPQDSPIESLRDICANQLGIPLILVDTKSDFSGATVSTQGNRGIVINTSGKNANIFVRRIVIAHELGHLLFDTDRTLKTLKLDTLDEADFQYSKGFFESVDYVEQRANAFAAELLAPEKSVRDFYNTIESDDPIREIMLHFGVGFITARFQLWNALERKHSLESFSTKNREPTNDWIARENYNHTQDYFPILETLSSRRGEFANLVVQAELKALISADTAAFYLGCSMETYHEQKKAIQSLFSWLNL
jgi:Zn-dependent peptidase ImmA (M78 family)/transcriptional regulator with XRE-family HTH domain